MTNMLYIYFPSSSTCFFYEKNFYEKMSLKKPQILRKYQKKSPTSNAWAVFKHADFSLSSLKVTKIRINFNIFFI